MAIWLERIGVKRQLTIIDQTLMATNSSVVVAHSPSGRCYPETNQR